MPVPRHLYQIALPQFTQTEEDGRPGPRVDVPGDDGRTDIARGGARRVPTGPGEVLRWVQFPGRAQAQRLQRAVHPDPRDAYLGGLSGGEHRGRVAAVR